MGSRGTPLWFAAVSLISCAGVFAARHAARTLAPASLSATARPETASLLRTLPLIFERNDGQFPADVRFVGVQSNGSIAILDDGFSIADTRFTFVNASRGYPTGVDRRRTRSNYFAGRDRRAWRTDIPTFGRIRRDHLYPNIDAVYYGRERQLEYDLVVRPGGDPRQVALHVDGGRARVDAASGDLVVEQEGRELRHQRPIAYQEIRGSRRDVAAQYVVDGDRVGIAVDAYDRTADLVIDPVVTYSTYLAVDDMFVDPAGGIHVVGAWSQATDLAPATTGFGAPGPGIHVARLSADGSGLDFSTFIAAAPVGTPRVAVDVSGTIYVAGYDAGGNAPLTLGDGPASGESTFVTALSSDGRQLLWSRFVGEHIRTTLLQPRPAGGVVLAGTFVTSADAFVSPAIIGRRSVGAIWTLKLSGSGSAGRPAIIGDGVAASPKALAVGADDSVYVGGTVTARDFPVTPGAIQPFGGWPGTSGFITRFEPSDVALAFSTYLGGLDESTFVGGLDVDSEGNAYVTGHTVAGELALFLTKLRPSGAVVYSRQLVMNDISGSSPTPVRVNAAGEAAVAFTARSPGLTSVASVQPGFGDGPVVESLDGMTSFFRRARISGSCERPVEMHFAPSDPRVLYLVSRNRNGHSLCRSTDGGRTWTETTLDANVSEYNSSVHVSRADAMTLLSRNPDGVRKSTDGGLTWVDSDAGLPNHPWISAVVVFDTADASVVYATFYAGPTDNPVYRSNDGGASWTRTPVAGMAPDQPPASLTFALPTTPMTLFAKNGVFVYRSVDGGMNWQLDPPLPAVVSHFLAVDPTNPSIVYASGSGPSGVCRSTNGAVSWTCRDTGLNEVPVSLVVDPSAPQRIYGRFGAFNGVLATSIDSGATWTRTSAFVSDGPIVADPTAPGRVLLAPSAMTSDAAIVKFSADGTRLVFSSYLGGLAEEIVSSLAIDAAGNLYVRGTTRSSDFPLVSARRATTRVGRSESPTDGFITKIAMSAASHSDFDAGGRTDVSVFRPVTGEWLIENPRLSAPETIVVGQNGDLPATADFNGDGQADAAVFRPSNGRWLIRDSSTLQVRTVQWGGSTADVPAPADYDGDGKADIAFFRPSNGYWYILQSATNSPRYVQWGGTASDKPAPGDYDRDGRADIAFFRPSNGYWYLLRSTAGIQYVQWGGTTADIPTPGDYDGDGKTDVAIWRPSDNYWYIRSSSSGAGRYVRWGGFPTDVPVPGDYDQDGITDTAFFRASDGYWYILQSRTRTARYVNLGTVGDIPIPSRR